MNHQPLREAGMTIDTTLFYSAGLVYDEDRSSQSRGSYAGSKFRFTQS